MFISAFNPSTDNLEKTFLSADYAAGVTTLTVRNSDRITADDFVLLGEMGTENAEIVQVSSVTNETTIVVGATSFPHNASDPVYVMKYDKIKFYRSITTIDGTYSNIATVDIDVDNADKRTRYDDSTGITSYFYKISLYNSDTTTESSLSGAIAGSGYTRKQVGAIVNDFLVEIGDTQQEYITVPQIISLINEVNDDLRGQSKKPYRSLSTSTTLSLTADDDRVSIASVSPEILKVDRVKYARTENGVTENLPIPVISIEEMEYKKSFENNTAAVAANQVDVIDYVAFDYATDEMVIYPTPTAAQTDVITLYYWHEISAFTSLSDTIELPNPRIYKLFLLGRHYRVRAKKESSFLTLSREYLTDYSTEILKLQRDQKLDVGTPMSMPRDTRRSRGLRR